MVEEDKWSCKRWIFCRLNLGPNRLHSFQHFNPNWVFEILNKSCLPGAKISVRVMSAVFLCRLHSRSRCVYTTLSVSNGKYNVLTWVNSLWFPPCVHATCTVSQFPSFPSVSWTSNPAIVPRPLHYKHVRFTWLTIPCNCNYNASNTLPLHSSKCICHRWTKVIKHKPNQRVYSALQTLCLWCPEWEVKHSAIWKIKCINNGLSQMGRLNEALQPRHLGNRCATVDAPRVPST